jgi:uncharacterized protein (DUF2147 family)
MGLVMLNGFTYNLDNQQWTGGSIYTPEIGGIFKAKMWMAGDNSLKLQASMMRLFSKTLTLTAVK